MAKTIGIIAIKGGVGKTTIAASLAADLVNSYKKKVLLVDANFSAPNLGLHMDIVEPKRTVHEVLNGKARIESAIHEKFGVDVIPGSYVYHNIIDPLKLKSRLEKISQFYDFIVLDSSPSLSEEILSTIQASDSLFVVTTPDYPTLSCSIKAAQLAKEQGRPIAGLIINKIQDPKYELTLKEIEKTLTIPVIARIPHDKNAVKALFTRIPLNIYNKKCSFAKEITKLNAALTNRPVQVSFFHKLLPFTMPKEEVNRQVLKQSFYNPVFKTKDG
jgi:septum site-determining protein MinD